MHTTRDCGESGVRHGRLIVAPTAVGDIRQWHESPLGTGGHTGRPYSAKRTSARFTLTYSLNRRPYGGGESSRLGGGNAPACVGR